MSVPVDLGEIESTIQVFEAETGWRISLPSRVVIQQLFISLAIDSGGFKVSMSSAVRETALGIAKSALPDFLKQCLSRSQELSGQSGYQGKEIGLPVVIREMNNSATMTKCMCWPE